MNKAIISLVLMCSCVGSTLAGDGKNTIDLTFSGTIVNPTCTINFDDNTANKAINFNTVNVSDLRYYGSGEIDTYTYSQEQSSAIFNVKITGCTPSQVSSNSSGKQFTFTIAPGAGGEWVDEGYMGGAIAPTSGATDFAAKIMVPSSYPTTATPDRWKTLTGTGITGRNDSRSDDDGVISSLGVAFSDLVTTGSGSTQAWLLPMKVKLGMKEVDSSGQNAGAFAVSAVISVTYF
jgi:type 1 fimbria pilin